MTAVVERPTDEAPLTLTEAPPRALGVADQLGLWANLAVTLTVPVAAVFILTPAGVPPLSIVAALTAIVVGGGLGSVLLGLGALPGARTGAPAMVLLRGLFGLRGSYVPTVLNVLQCIGWAVVEVVIIAESAARLTDDAWKPVFVVLAGAAATLLALRPLGVVRSLRRYAVWAVALATTYLFVQVLREPLPSLTEGSWDGFWRAFDVAIALPVSWIPLAADYSRHARSGRSAFVGAAGGYGTAVIVYFALGVLAVSALRPADGDVLGALLAVPIGALAVAILVLDELDEAFANLYSSAVSVQNAAPRADRRLVAASIGVLATVLAFWADIADYESYLFLIGSVFVPLFAVFAVDYYVLRRGRWDVSASARGRWAMGLPWLAGFVAYQLVTPTYIPWWYDLWVDIQGAVGVPADNRLSGSLVSFAVAAVLTLVVGAVTREGARPRAGAGAP